MKKNNKLIVFGISTILLVVVAAVGLTYAFFTASVEGNDEAEATEITTGTLKLRLTDTNVMDMDNAMPGRTETKTFTVENIGDTSASYDILLVDVSTSFIGSDLVYTITSNNDGGSKLETVLPNTDETIIENVVIEPGITQTYTLTITFKETGLDQNQNQGASYTGLIQISPRISSGTVVGYVRDAGGNVMPNTLVQMHSEPKETRTNESGYYEFRNVEAGIHTISVLDNSNEVLASKEVTMLVGTETIKQKENIIVIETSPKKYVNLQVAANQGLNINVDNEEVMLSETVGDLYIGGSSKSITISGEGYGALSCIPSTENVTCSITNNILTISPISAGAGTITVSEDRTNVQVTYTYEVKDTSITLSETSGDLLVGDTVTATISGTNMGVLYCGTSDSAKATCTIEGTTLTINAISEGSATITVRERNGNKTATYIITIINEIIETFTYNSLGENARSFTAPIQGYYQVELWGAEGGYGYTTHPSYLNTSNGIFKGGYGAYTSGIIFLSQGQTIGIHLGGKGTDNYQSTSRVLGGYNGGGEGGIDTYNSDTGGGGGGGATDVRFNGNDFKDRIMVAAGGGGGSVINYSVTYNDVTSRCGLGTMGGGLNNISFTIYKAMSGPTVTGFGATQISNALYFGQATNGGSGNQASGGGGGGYYGGTTETSTIGQAGAGGSSYISGHLGCVAIASNSSLDQRLKSDNITKCTETNAKTDVKCSEHYSGRIFTNTKMIDGAGNIWTTVLESQDPEGMPNPFGGNYPVGTGHIGNGYARITYISNIN